MNTAGWRQSFHHLSLTNLLRLTVLFLIFGGAVSSCTSSATTLENDLTAEPDTATTQQQTYAGKKIVWVDSYHAEYEWSTAVEAGIRNALEGTGVELQIIRLDTKSNPSEEFGLQAGREANAAIENINPDVVIACDDNAQKYLVVPYLYGTDTPVVFCGVNWDASIYNYPTNNVTGVLEVELPDRVVELLKPYAQGDRLAILTIESETENKVVDTYNERFFGGEMKVYAVNTFEEFKSAFLQAQDEVDILFLGNNAGADRWDEAEMTAFVLENSQIPTGTIYDWMAPYSLISLAKFGEEQGELSVQAALAILDGAPISNIPITENKEGRLILNLDIAERLDIVFAPSILRNAEVISSRMAEGN